MRDLQAQASVINAIEIEYMKTAMRYNESLPPEDRRPQAPTADTIRKMQEERLILQ